MCINLRVFACRVHKRLGHAQGMTDTDGRRRARTSARFFGPGLVRDGRFLHYSLRSKAEGRT